MHFLGAVIGGSNTSEAEAIIDPYSEYEEVEEYVLYTRDEFLKDNQENDRRLIEREGENQHDRTSEAFEKAERRLALNDESARSLCRILWVQSERRRRCGIYFQQRFVLRLV